MPTQETANYPGAYDVLTDKEAKQDKVAKADFNRIQNILEALEAELGLNVAGDQTDLVTRLAYCLEDDGSFKHGTSFPGSPRTGDYFFRTDENIAYIYNGSWRAQSGITSYAAGSYQFFGPTLITTGNNASYTKVQEIYVPRSGTIRIVFGLASKQGTSGNGSARIYRNGSAVGTVRSRTGGDLWIDYSEDISGWATGDLLQIYAKHDGDANGIDVGAVRLYENVPPEPTCAASAGYWRGVSNIYRADTNLSAYAALGAIGDFYIRLSGQTYVKTGSSTWTLT